MRTRERIVYVNEEEQEEASRTYSMASKPPPSAMAKNTVEFNESEIDAAVRVAALQAMPVCLARGHRTTLEKQQTLMRECIEELIRQAIDDEETNLTESVGIYEIDIALAEHFGKGISDKAKNLYQFSITISILLEWTSFQFPPEHYAKAKRCALKHLGPPADT